MPPRRKITDRLRENLEPPGEASARGVQTRRGQVQDQDSPVVKEKALEQPLVRTGGIRGRTTLRRESPVVEPGKLTAREKFRLEGPGVRPELFPGPVKEAPIKVAGERVTGGLRKLAVPRPIEAEAEAPPAEPRGPGGIKPAAAPKKSFNILNFEGIENIFSSAGELAAHFASPEFQAERRRARTAAASRKGRTSELKSIDSSIRALSGALADVSVQGDEELESTLASQLSAAVKQREEVSAGTSGTQGRSSLDLTTPEGFMTFLAGRNIPKEEGLSITRRIFADGA